MKNEKEAATSEEMPASNKVAESATPEGAQEDAQEQTPGTTDTLFPEQVSSEKAEAEPSAENAAQTEDSSSTEELAAKTPKAEPTEQMVKTVVDGVEKEIPLSELTKGYQTGQHLFKEGQKIGEERRSLEDLKAEILESTKNTGAQDTQQEELADEYVDPEILKVRQELKDLKALVGKQGETIDSTAQTTAPLAYQNSLSTLDTNMKGRGYEDFMQFVPQIEEEIMALPVEQQTKAWSEDYFSRSYLELKLKAMQTVSEPSTLANADARPDPKVVPIESANSSGSRVDDGDAAYTKAVATAKQTGDWGPVFKMKNIAGFK